MEELHTLKGGNGGGSDGSKWDGDLKEVEIVGEAPPPDPPGTGDGDNYPDPEPEEDTDWDDDWGGGGDPGDDPGESSTQQGIQLSALTRLMYPTLAKVVDGLKDKVKNDVKLLNAIKDFTKLSEAQILEKLGNTQGPELIVNRYMGDTNPGKYQPNDNPNVMYISEKLVNSTNFIQKDYGTALEFYMAVVILHEFVHYGQNYTGNYTPYDNSYKDVGYQFENEVFGGRVVFNYATGEITYEKL